MSLGRFANFASTAIIRLRGAAPMHLILEIKGFDRLGDVKHQAADRCVNAVNADGRHGRWGYEVVKDIGLLDEVLHEVSTTIGG